MAMEDFQAAVDAGSFGLIVDDSGSPGVQPNNLNLPKEAKTLIGVLVPPAAMPVVAEQMPGVLDEIHSLTGAQELHFVDIYGARKQWKGVDQKVRLGIFRFMSWIFEQYQLKLIVQTFDHEQHQDLLKKMGINKSGPFDLENIEDAALMFLLIRAKWHMQELQKYAPARASVFIDAGNGWKRPGTKHKIKSFSDIFINGEFGFYESDKMLPIQLADFAAFFHNRTRLIMNKPQPTDFDRELIEIIQPLQRGYLNIPTIPWEEWFPGTPKIH
jgi:hypothetical protein